MAETLQGEVIHAVPPGELDEHEATDELRALAESQYVLVCREGGSPSWVERVRSFLLRRPIEPVTVVTETAASEGQEVTATVVETDIAGVYEATDMR